MTWAVVLVAVWVACSVAAYFIFRSLSLRVDDYTRSDRRFVLGLSMLGPSSLIAAACAWVSRRPRRADDDILIPKGGRWVPPDELIEEVTRAYEADVKRRTEQ